MTCLAGAPAGGRSPKSGAKATGAPARSRPFAWAKYFWSLVAPGEDVATLLNHWHHRHQVHGRLDQPVAEAGGGVARGRVGDHVPAPVDRLVVRRSDALGVADDPVTVEIGALPEGAEGRGQRPLVN